ncbi:MAG: LacI family DNA-binding transcriptional regulator, partial [Clostridia bacterium]|nr:LacI family DNA-binding transcriptional regulator [Clostridia bacterium]
MAVTIKELSAACGLSISTVSKALNDYPDVSAETRELVRATAAKLGYRPSAIARGLKIGRTFNLGVLYSDDSASGFTHNYFAPVLEAFKNEAERRGYDITFITHRTGRNNMTYLQHCLYRNVDGVCIVNCHFDDPEVRELLAGPLSVVTIDHMFHNRSCVESENRQGMTDLTRHILSKGHTRVAYICGENNAVTTIRRTSFLRAMQEAGLQVPQEYLIYSQYHHPAAAREATQQLLALKNRPTCIIMADDYAALGGLEAIREAGLRVPQDISVAGYDGVGILQMCRPQLTTVQQDTLRIGQAAARKLVHLIEQ